MRVRWSNPSNPGFEAGAATASAGALSGRVLDTEPGSVSGPRLGLIEDLFRQLHDGDLRYCHWKSNEHLAASLAGKTDLDLLVARNDFARLAPILAELGFKRCLTVAGRGYPAVESYLGLDYATGALVHLHLHYQLTLGERYLKGYRVPWETLALSTRIRAESEGIFVIEPHLELVLLAVRVALKVRWRDRLRGALGGGRLSAGVRRELAWLVTRVDPARLSTLATELVGERAALQLNAIAADNHPTGSAFHRFGRLARPSLSEYRTYARLESRARRWAREVRSRWLGRRRLPQGGLVVALVGADGSGKSTLSSGLTTWLARHLDVVPLYFGSGQGAASGMRRAMAYAARTVMRASRGERTANRGTRRGHRGSAMATVGDMAWILLLARERRRRATQARRARNRGLIVLCDRFPQSQFPRNDGPWLQEWMTHPSWLRRTVARAELAAIEYTERVRPDVILKLNVTLDVARSRKSDTQLPALQAKIDVVERLKFTESTHVVEIDATRPLDEVVLEARRALWRRM